MLQDMAQRRTPFLGALLPLAGLPFSSQLARPTTRSPSYRSLKLTVSSRQTPHAKSPEARRPPRGQSQVLPPSSWSSPSRTLQERTSEPSDGLLGLFH